MTAVRQDPFARLDAWVLEELEALNPRPRPVERARRRAESEPANFDEAVLAEGPLPLDENQFVQRVTEWLQSRPNADMILEEIWRNVVSPDALGDDLAGDSADEAALGADDLADEAPPADAAPEGPASSADGTPPPLQG